MTRKQKLELTWVGKENRPRLEPRILLEDSEKSYHAAHRITFSKPMVFCILSDTATGFPGKVLLVTVWAQRV